MLGGEAKKRKKVVAMGSFGNAKLFVDKDVKKSKEQAPEMTRVIQCICIGSVPWENEKNKVTHIDLTPMYRMINRIVACNIHPMGHIAEI
ncbi:unnamed protein product [Ilex paraguariensis]|uniref:Uncharacterized protein n=1 Tax=Ilex paraguariensis TaxID=185542 RepID=A0ABC8SDU7_9AQUA